MSKMQKQIVLFDGVCHFCSQSVQFIIKRDKQERFQFASLQGEVGQQLLTQYHTKNNINSMVLIQEGRVYTRSTAALKIANELDGAWKLCCACIIIPRFMRDKVYDIIANNRYKWFGKKDVCTIPSPQMRKRFLD
ncbi:thiol-disulfide oxidoreductase DCC family protein [Pontibacillus litoralis]|nr:thiol-disulfide oxidoreductase DCC family protein [Pontibacillus litoralis]